MLRLDEHRTFVDAAAAAGVRQLVYTSFYGAAPDATFTLMRDLPLMAGTDGVLGEPAAHARSTYDLTGPEARTLAAQSVTGSRTKTGISRSVLCW